MSTAALPAFPRRLSAVLRLVATTFFLGCAGLLAACGGGSGGGGSSGGSGAAAPTLVSISVTPATPSIANGSVQQFAATGLYSDNSKQTLTSVVTWSTSDTAVATISNVSASAGLATAVGVSTAPITVTATDGGITGTATLSVTAATLVSIALTPATSSIAKGATEQFVAMGTYTDKTRQDLTDSVTWSSSNPTVASIGSSAPSQGLATALTVGTTSISATSGTVAAPAVTLTVTGATIASIAVTPASPSIAKGTTQQFTATATYSDGTTGDVTAAVVWSSGTPAATISNAPQSQGIATGVGVSTAPVTITATTTATANGTAVAGSTTLSVTAATLVSLAVTPTNPTISAGSSNHPSSLQFKATGTYTDASTQDLTGTAVWTSGTPGVATISNANGSQGVAQAVAVGTTAVSAAAQGSVTSPAVTLTVATTIYAYATNFTDNTVSEFEVAGNGTLTPLSTPTIASGHNPFSISVEPTGEYAYVANYGDDTVSQYTIGAGGVLSPVGTGTVPTGHNPNSVTIDPADLHAYVANYGAGTVSQFTIGANGALIPMSVPLVTAGAKPASVTIAPNGLYAYVANYGSGGLSTPNAAGTVSQYDVGSDGALTPMSIPTVVTGAEPNAVVVDPTSTYVYVANVNDNDVTLYNIGAGGALLPNAVQANVATGVHPFGLAIDPTGSYLYVANSGSNTISQFSIGTGGVLTALTVPTVAAGAGVSSVTVDPTGKYLYATNRAPSSTMPSTLSQYLIGTDGSLTPNVPATQASGVQPTSIALGY